MTISFEWQVDAQERVVRLTITETNRVTKERHSVILGRAEIEKLLECLDDQLDLSGDPIKLLPSASETQ